MPVKVHHEIMTYSDQTLSVKTQSRKVHPSNKSALVSDVMMKSDDVSMR